MLENHTPPILLEELGMFFPRESSKKKKRYGIYKCDCGKKFKAQYESIRSGNTKSCGCLNIKSHTTHGLSATRIYRIWNHMINRCYDVNNLHYVSYGARGIKVCDEWKNNIHAFYDWATRNGYREHLTIDRIDNDGIYEPNNCRWSTYAVQSRNKRKLMSTNKSGYKGAYWHNSKKKWCAQIRVDYLPIYLGTYSTAIEAAKAYDNYVTIHNLEHTKNFS